MTVSSVLIQQGEKKYQRDESMIYRYGTAGFRYDSSILPPVMFRVGICAALRSLSLNGSAVGVMITASHNPPQDNGVKLCDPNGDMINPTWEKYATELANSSNLFEFIQTLKLEGSKAVVVLGRDTRDTSQEFANICKEGILAVGGEIIDIGVCSTPQLHYHTLTYSKSMNNDYFERISSGFNNLVQNAKSNNNYAIDCANGVGTLPLKKFLQIFNNSIHVTPVNTDIENTSKLNVECGADFVQKKKVWPANLNAGSQNNSFASLDGDADRIVFYYLDKNKQFVLLDGDQIAALIVDFISEQATIGGIKDKLSIGIVQTAYANGSSTAFLKGRGVSVVCTATGVKYLHKEAHHYDIGIYFEANGHGTCLLSDNFFTVLSNVLNDPNSSENQKSAIYRLQAFSQIINPAVGDAISDFLAVAGILQIRGWTLSDWHDRTYRDIPSIMTVVRVKDRTVITTTPDETKALSPSGLQEKIDEAVAQFGGPKGRSFVRPSGTEDVIRVYGEAETEEDARKLTIEVMKIVFLNANGVGELPTTC